MDDIRCFKVGFSFLALAILVLALLFTSWARAQETTEDFPPGDDNIVPLAQGERAPFDGQLFDTNTAIRWGFRLQRLRLQLDVDVARERELCAAQTELLHTKLQLEQDRYTFSTGLLTQERDALRTQVSDLTLAVAEAQDVPWYKTFSFGMAVGVVGSALLAVATYFLITAVD